MESLEANHKGTDLHRAVKRWTLVVCTLAVVGTFAYGCGEVQDSYLYKLIGTDKSGKYSIYRHLDWGAVVSEDHKNYYLIQVGHYPYLINSPKFDYLGWAGFETSFWDGSSLAEISAHARKSFQKDGHWSCVVLHGFGMGELVIR